MLSVSLLNQLRAGISPLGGRLAFPLLVKTLVGMGLCGDWSGSFVLQVGMSLQ